MGKGDTTFLVFGIAVFPVFNEGDVNLVIVSVQTGILNADGAGDVPTANGLCVAVQFRKTEVTAVNLFAVYYEIGFDIVSRIEMAVTYYQSRSGSDVTDLPGLDKAFAIC